MQDPRKDLSHLHGPFDIVGDIHGCFTELAELLTRLGYTVFEGEAGQTARPPAGRMLIFLGDLVDRGPGIVPVLQLVMNMVQEGTALCVPGNHDVKLLRKLQGRDIPVKHGMAISLEQLEREPEAFRRRVIDFVDNIIDHYILDDGRLAVTHAGLKEEMLGKSSPEIRQFALFGEKTGEIDEFGFPIRYNWAAEYRGKPLIVYGHTPVPEAQWQNNTVNIDTGCVFGGKLTALRYPERELVSVPAHRIYWPGKPIFARPNSMPPQN